MSHIQGQQSDRPVLLGTVENSSQVFEFAWNDGAEHPGYFSIAEPTDIAANKQTPPTSPKNIVPLRRVLRNGSPLPTDRPGVKIGIVAQGNAWVRVVPRDPSISQR